MEEQLRRQTQDSYRRAEQLQREKQNEANNAQRAQLETQQAVQRANQLREEARKKDEEITKALQAQKEVEARWRKGLRPVELPSREHFEATKRRFYREGKFHVAIAGISGAGKSSLINALRGIWDGQKGAASTDYVESTSVVTSYPDPNAAKPFIWFDVPGSGTLACSDWTYFNDQGLYIFDAIIVLFNDRFTATDVAILKNAGRYKIPTYIVRSKSDVHVNNLFKRKRRRAGAGSDPAKLLDEARKEFITKSQESVKLNLMRNDPPLQLQKMYAVSRDTLTLIVREEPLEENLVLDELELLKEIRQDACSRRSHKSYASMAGLW
ncbi:interferon-inducible GTPase-domain-containing protein [Desarmillaria tabescens]|uniref:Interferon-inducible GTPase-domain-containing protein n=1 Tax=Armillaria tabescens TaxID=1929756 RepID=A0AA39NBI2_ARMTA|nr:interferon-inducible GTPase-domain-containing protein [Desarmillaria tabescens]KAK0462473.1 interferon-inducible GTPase-domain-containing protein [Desarmillaria tabescens]